MVTKNNSSTTVARCTQRKAATSEYVPSKGTILVHAQAYTEQQVESVYQACLDTRATLVNLRGQVAAALTARKQADATMNAFDAGMKDWVGTTFGPQSQQAVDFGYAKKPPQKPLVQTKALAQARPSPPAKHAGPRGRRSARRSSRCGHDAGSPGDAGDSGRPDAEVLSRGIVE